MARRVLPWTVLLAASLHLLGITRSLTPAQDGLKFIRVAREFQTRPWADAIRGSDRHPLYPAAIALTQPAIARLTGPGPTSWRVAAQAVSATAMIAIVLLLFGFVSRLFDEPTAALASLFFVLLPLPAEVGHDTLSDGLALALAMLALRFGEVALRSSRLAPALGCGVAAGFGFLTRPEVLIVPLAVVVAQIGRLRGEERLIVPSRRLAAVGLSALTIVGTYALIKGEVSEKLALRIGAGIAARREPLRPPAHRLPAGLDDARWNFSAKEESDAPARTTLLVSIGRVLGVWAEGMGYVLVPLAIWGAWRARCQGEGRMLVAIYVFLFAAILVRHAMTLGYLSGRHVLSIVLVTVPWAAAGGLDLARRVGTRLGAGTDRGRRWGIAALAITILLGVVAQWKPAHPTRWGHWAAGRWLLGHSLPTDAVLDTRGWAAFVSGRPSYDYWHVPQALTDARLAYIVVGADELTASSRRAATLRALLEYTATRVATFPAKQGGAGDAVQVFRFRPPASWEGMGR